MFSKGIDAILAMFVGFMDKAPSYPRPTIVEPSVNAQLMTSTVPKSFNYNSR